MCLKNTPLLPSVQQYRKKRMTKAKNEEQAEKDKEKDLKANEAAKSRRFFQAIHDNDIKAVQENITDAIKNKPDINNHDRTPLHQAIFLTANDEKDRTAIITFFLQDKGILIGSRNAANKTALMMAVTDGNAQIVNLFLTYRPESRHDMISGMNVYAFAKHLREQRLNDQKSQKVVEIFEQHNA